MSHTCYSETISLSSGNVKLTYIKTPASNIKIAWPGNPKGECRWRHGSPAGTWRRICRFSGNRQRDRFRCKAVLQWPGFVAERPCHRVRSWRPCGGSVFWWPAAVPMGDFDTRSFWVFTSFPVRCHTDRVLICSWMPPFLRYVDRAYWKAGMPGNEKSAWLSF